MTSPTESPGRWAATKTPPVMPKAFVFDYGGVLAVDGFSDPSPEAVDVVTAIAGRGLPLVLASNTDRIQPIGIRTRQLQQAGIAACFALVLESEKLGFAKPDPRIFHVVRDALKALAPHAEPHEITWVEDKAARGVVPALQYGWNVAWVGGDPTDRLAAVPGVHVIASIADLPGAVGLPR